MSKEVTSNFKEQIVCECGCGLEGTPRTRVYKNGTRHIRNCGRDQYCPQCVGKKWKAKGGKDQRNGKKELGIKSMSSLHTGHEENDDTPWENKAGAAFTGPSFRAWDKAEKQYENNRPIGRGPLLFLRMSHDDFPYSLVVLRGGERLREAWERLGRNKGWL